MNTPLAYRIRPQTLEDIIGQEELVGPNGFLTSCVNTNTLVSIIFYGQPGCGKTTLAEAFARSMNAHFIKLNAVTSNKKDLENAIEESKLFPSTIIIMDEVHRMNKDKQDLLLPYVESGQFYLIGATTANPFISINPAIRSRCHLLEVKSLTSDDIKKGIKKAISHPNGLNNVTIDDEALNAIANASGGDMRFALNILEVSSLNGNRKHITLDIIKQITKIPNYLIDNNAEDHYNSVSALQKSIRGSDVDASLYYLARLLAAGDLESIERRLLVIAYEDVGLANPQAVQRCATALESAKKVGFPECIIPLGFTVCDLALSPKSRASSNAIEKAMELVNEKPLDVLDYLKYTPVNLSEEDKYPYDRPDLWEKIQYLPNLIKNIKLYEPSYNSAYEKSLNTNYDRLQKIDRSNNLSNLKKNIK